MNADLLSGCDSSHSNVGGNYVKEYIHMHAAFHVVRGLSMMGRDLSSIHTIKSCEHPRGKCR